VWYQEEVPIEVSKKSLLIANILTHIPMYDYVVIGAGLFGCVFAHEMTKRGRKCLVIDKRNHVGGNLFSENIEGINVHRYGPHIFHTNDRRIWEYVNSFVEFNNFVFMPLANYDGKLYNLPFNMNTFQQLWGVNKPADARRIIFDQTKSVKISHPRNLEEYALKTVGPEIYYKFIKGYTEKQWGKRAQELPVSIIKRIPISFTYDNRYFHDKYQGIPKGGYNELINGLLKSTKVLLNINYFTEKSEIDALAKKIVYSGLIDHYFANQFGALDYRGLLFEHEILEQDNFQNNAMVNYTDVEVSHTRIVEHKHFEFGTQKGTVITKEYPLKWKPDLDPYYPINDKVNSIKYGKYSHLAKQEKKVIFGGRLAEYRYYNMDQIVGRAFIKVNRELDLS